MGENFRTDWDQSASDEVIGWQLGIFRPSFGKGKQNYYTRQKLKTCACPLVSQSPGFPVCYEVCEMSTRI